VSETHTFSRNAASLCESGPTELKTGAEFERFLGRLPSLKVRSVDVTEARKRKPNATGPGGNWSILADLPLSVKGGQITRPVERNACDRLEVGPNSI
jgi:hypothetical protein